MTLIECWECSARISDHAATCPCCGAPYFANPALSSGGSESDGPSVVGDVEAVVAKIEARHHIVRRWPTCLLVTLAVIGAIIASFGLVERIAYLALGVSKKVDVITILLALLIASIAIWVGAMGFFMDRERVLRLRKNIVRAMLVLAGFGVLGILAQITGHNGERVQFKVLDQVFVTLAFAVVALVAHFVARAALQLHERRQRSASAQAGALTQSATGRKVMSGAYPPSPKGIGGWLILVVIGLIVSPLRSTYFLATNYWPLFRDGVWQQLTTPSTEAYHALWAPLIIFEIVGNLGAIALGLFTLWFLFRRSRRTPRLAIAWLTWMTAFVVIDYFAAELIPAVAAQSDTESTKELIRSLVAPAIWVPYFLVSKRVRATFVGPD
jgi:hypothetical protein